ncbi:MAG: chloride channel protein [Clostridia bacterium]|nr:chloride channel protein [Clostridia bacterium]
MKKEFFANYVKNIILPCLIFSLITGILTGFIVVLYKIAANKVFELSDCVYAFIKNDYRLIFAAIAAVGAIAFLGKYFYKFIPDARGGGIAAAMGFVRGLLTFKWLRTLIGTLFASLVTFFIGTPLGNEGPSVLAGATVGRGVVKIFGKNNPAWDRYMMTGGACAGFAVATNAPLTGVLFAVEEAHNRLSPMIIMVAGATVCFSLITSRIISPFVNIDPNLFANLSPIVLAPKHLWIAALIGIVCGFESVLFNKIFQLINKFVNVKLKKVNKWLTMFVIFTISVICCTYLAGFGGTGHHLVEQILHKPALPFLILLLYFVLRAILTAGGAAAGITGGTFIPILTLGALASAMLANILEFLGLITQDYYQVIILMGMASCFAGMTKTPITAITFAMEALALTSNVLGVAVCVFLTYIITEIFCPHSINDTVLETRVENQNEGKVALLIDTIITVKQNSFVVGKSIRDILWPNNLFVLSIKKNNGNTRVDQRGETTISAGDKLHVRFSSYNVESTHDELQALVGNQTFEDSEWVEDYK